MAVHLFPPFDYLSGSMKSAEACDRILKILGVDITDVDTSRAIQIIEEGILNPKALPKSIFFVNAHTLNLATANAEYRETMNTADHVFGDGTGVRWAARLQGVRVKDNLVGTDLVPNLFRQTANRGYSYYMLGSDQATVDKAARYSCEKFPGWRLAGKHHGFVKERADLLAALDDIDRTNPDVVLVGMGNPLQEEFVRKHLADLNTRVCMAIGGLFDYWADNVSRAPNWVRSIGYEWVWRLYQQPVDKASRYLLGNPMFLYRILAERLSGGSKPAAVSINSKVSPPEKSKKDVATTMAT